MMVTIETYARRWRCAAKKLVADQRIRMLAQTVLHILGKFVEDTPYLIIRVQIADTSRTMPHAFDWRDISLGHDRRVILTIGKAP